MLMDGDLPGVEEFAMMEKIDEDVVSVDDSDEDSPVDPHSKVVDKIKKKRKRKRRIKVAKTVKIEDQNVDMNLIKNPYYEEVEIEPETEKNEGDEVDMNHLNMSIEINFSSKNGRIITIETSEDIPVYNSTQKPSHKLSHSRLKTPIQLATC